MSKIEVIKKNEEFQRVFEKGHSIYGRYLVVYFLHNALNYNRFGFCVGKKIGTAVKRNRIKRLLREAVGAVAEKPFTSWDILLVARGVIQRASLIDIILEIKHILDKAMLIKTLYPDSKDSKMEDSQ